MSSCYVIHMQDTADPNNLSITVFGIAYNGTSNVKLRKLALDTTSKVYEGEPNIWGTGLAIGKAQTQWQIHNNDGYNEGNDLIPSINLSSIYSVMIGSVNSMSEALEYFQQVILNENIIRIVSYYITMNGYMNTIPNTGIVVILGIA